MVDSFGARRAQALAAAAAAAGGRSDVLGRVGVLFEAGRDAQARALLGAELDAAAADGGAGAAALVMAAAWCDDGDGELSARAGALVPDDPSAQAGWHELRAEVLEVQLGEVRASAQRAQALSDALVAARAEALSAELGRANEALVGAAAELTHARRRVAALEGQLAAAGAAAEAAALKSAEAAARAADADGRAAQADVRAARASAWVSAADPDAAARIVAEAVSSRTCDAAVLAERTSCGVQMVSAVLHTMEAAQVAHRGSDGVLRPSVADARQALVAMGARVPGLRAAADRAEPAGPDTPGQGTPPDEGRQQRPEAAQPAAGGVDDLAVLDVLSQHAGTGLSPFQVAQLLGVGEAEAVEALGRLAARSLVVSGADGVRQLSAVEQQKVVAAAQAAAAGPGRPKDAGKVGVDASPPPPAQRNGHKIPEEFYRAAAASQHNAKYVSDVLAAFLVDGSRAKDFGVFLAAMAKTPHAADAFINELSPQGREWFADRIARQAPQLGDGKGRLAENLWRKQAQAHWKLAVKGTARRNRDDPHLRKLVKDTYRPEARKAVVAVGLAAVAASNLPVVAPVALAAGTVAAVRKVHKQLAPVLAEAKAAKTFAEKVSVYATFSHDLRKRFLAAFGPTVRQMPGVAASVVTVPLRKASAAAAAAPHVRTAAAVKVKEQPAALWGRVKESAAGVAQRAAQDWHEIAHPHEARRGREARGRSGAGVG